MAMSASTSNSGAPGQSTSSLQAIKNRFRMGSIRAKSTNRRKSDILTSLGPYDDNTLHIVALNGRPTDAASFDDAQTLKRDNASTLSRPSASTLASRDSLVSQSSTALLSGQFLRRSPSASPRAASLEPPNGSPSSGSNSPHGKSSKAGFSADKIIRNFQGKPTLPALAYSPPELGPIVATSSSSDDSGFPRMSRRSVISRENPTLVTKQHGIPQSLSGQIVTRQELRKKRSISESFLDLRGNKQWLNELEPPPDRKQSPLDELIAGLGGRRPSAQGSSDGHSHGLGMTEMSPFLPQSTNASQPADAREELTDDEDKYDSRRGTFSDGDPRLSRGTFTDPKLQSTWSATDSARSSRATGLTRISTPEPSDLSQSAPKSNDSPIDPHINLPQLAKLLDTARHHSSLDLSFFSSRANVSRNISSSSRRWSINEMEEAYQRMKDMVISANGSQLGESMFSRPEEFNTSSEIEQTPRLTQAETDSPRDKETRSAEELSAERFWAAAADSQRSLADQPTPRPEVEYAAFPDETDDENVLTVEQSETDEEDRIETPDSFKTTLSAQQLAPPLPDINTSASVYSREDSPETIENHVDTPEIQQNPVQSPTRNNVPLALPKSTRTRTTESVKSGSTANDGWRTPQTSISPLKSERPSTEYINAWLPTVRSGEGSKIGSPRRAAQSKVRPTANVSSSSSSHTVPGGNFARGESRDSRHRESSVDPGEDTTTWFADTPARQKQRQRQAIPSRFTKHGRKSSQGSHRSSNTPASPTISTSTFSHFRDADKIELFLRFTQTNAELEALRKQSQMEKEALLDALGETRSVVHDLRQQRNALEDQLRRQQSESSRRTQSQESLQSGDRMSAVLRSKKLWQERAQVAADELERNRKVIDDLRRQAKEAIDREEELTNETIFLGARVASLTNQLREATEDGGRSAGDNALTALVTDRKHVSDSPSRLQSPSRKRASPNINTTPSRMPAPRQRVPSNNDSLLGFDRVDVTGTPLLSTKPAFVAETPASVWPSHRNVTNGASKIPSKVSPQSGRTGIPRMSASAGSSRTRAASAQTTSTHSRASSSSLQAGSPISLAGFPEEHIKKPINGFGWSQSTASKIGLTENDERFLAEI